MPKIFISYGRDASHGQSLATEAQQQLQSAGFEVFRDVIGLKPGDVWYSKLEFELDSSDLVVLIVSEKVRTSDWVHNEISMAREIGLPIIPVIAEQVRMPLWLRHLQALDFSVQTDWQQLMDTIFSHGIENEDEYIPTVSEVLEPFSALDDIPTVREVISVPECSVTPTIRESIGKEESVSLSLKPDIRVESKHNESFEPSWAIDSGEDQYGQYADLQIKNVIQRFRLIQPGTFQMGSPDSEKERQPWDSKEMIHQVTLSQAFWLADTTCTQALWSVVMSNNPSHFKANENNPVERVTWNSTQAFNHMLTTLKPGLSLSLPTEAQWEYACRAGTSTPFSFGKNITPEQVNFNGNYPYANGQEGLYRKETVPVKSLTANRWGLYEMHGNVWEWCQDTFQEDLGGQACTDPVNDAKAGQRVIRGGSWFENGRFCRSAHRGCSAPDIRDLDVGFRLALVN